MAAARLRRRPLLTDSPPSSPLRAPLLLALFVVVAGLGLGLHRGLLLSNDVKSMTWPWAPSWRTHAVAVPALSDPVWQFVPWLELARRQLLAGEWPLWNPHQEGGVPLLGNAQSALLSPFHWPSLAFGVVAGWNLGILLRLLAAFSGTWLWLRRRAPLGAPAAAAAVALSGPMVAWLEHPHTATVAWMPWLLWSIDRCSERRSPRAGLGLAIVTALTLVGGHPETQAMMALLAAAYLLWRAPGLRSGLATASWAGAGALLAAPAILPFVEYYLLSAARHGHARTPMVLPWSDLAAIAAWWRPTSHPVEAAAAVSMPILIFAALALWRRVPDWRFWLGVALAVVAVTYTNPLASTLANVTGWYWQRALLFLPLALAALAAPAIDCVAGVRPRWVALGIFAAVLIELVAAAQGRHGSADFEELSPTTPVIRALQADAEPGYVLPLHTMLPTNLASTYGLDDLRGYDALAVAEFRRQRETIGRFTSVPTQSDVVEPWDLVPGGRALDVGNVRYLLLHPLLKFDPRAFDGLELESIYQGPDGVLLRNRRAQPRFRLPGARIEVRERSWSRWTLEIVPPSGGRLDVAQPYFPGWRLAADGQDVAWLEPRPGWPLAAEIPPNTKALELVYRPLSFRLGVGLFFLGAALLVIGSKAAADATSRRLNPPLVESGIE